MESSTNFVQGIVEGYNRYKFSATGEVFNNATGKEIKREESGDRKYYRLTNDLGERKQVNVSEIIAAFEPKAPEVAPEPAPAVKKEKTPKVAAPTKPRGKKLSEDQVREIRSKRKEGVSAKELSAIYGVHSSTISEIVSYKLYKNVDPVTSTEVKEEKV